MKNIDWHKICTSLSHKIQKNLGAAYFIKNGASFENWIQVELVGLLPKEKLEIERLKNNNTDIKCNNNFIEIKISKRKSRKITGKYSIAYDLEEKRTDFIVVIAFDLKGSDFAKYHFDDKNRVFIPRRNKKRYPIISYSKFRMDQLVQFSGS